MADVDQVAAESQRLCDEGYRLLEAGRFDEALVLLTRARTLSPDNALVHYRTGLLYSDTQRPRDALASYDIALRLEPGNVRTLNNRGSALQQLGRLAEAEAAFRQAIAIAPDLAIPYVNLGKLLELAGRSDDAATLYRQAIGRGVDPALFAHHVAAVTGQATERAPESWVKATFDNFAPQFDVHLQALGYDAPSLLAGMLLDHINGSFDALDLGCGTGLCGVALATRKRRMVGVDLSDKMAQLATNRGVYDQVIVADIESWLDAADPAQFDAAIAADVFIYVGKLERVFAALARVMRPGGWLAFSTEERDGADYQLLRTGRYAQSLAYIRRLAQGSFVIESAEPHVIRMEEAVPLPGRLYLLRRT